MKISTPVSLFLWIIILGGGFVSIWALVRDATAPRPSVNFPPSKWNELRIGMSKREVEDLLGKPSLASPRPWNGVSSAPPLPSLSPWEAIVVHLYGIWGLGWDKYCDNYWSFYCDCWEYDGGPTATPRPFIQVGSFAQAFVVYFHEGKVLWFRKPTTGQGK